MPDTFYMEKIRELVNNIKHKFTGCEPFWVVQLNKNKKPFKRLCSHCGMQEQRRNGEWWRLPPKLNRTNHRW